MHSPFLQCPQQIKQRLIIKLIYMLFSGLCDYSILTNCDAGYLETESFANKFDCAKYYLCQGRILHMRTCPGSDVYIVQTRMCGIKPTDDYCSESGRCQTRNKTSSSMLIDYLKSLKINNN